MCGITGKLHWGDDYVSGLVEKMTERIAHRGPDDSGVVHLDDISLGHRRLSIIDLSSNARQPLCNVAKSHWIVYNGEVYNFQSIRKELEIFGYKFVSQSDTEVIVNAYEKWGPECLNKFNGMFAFAIWDVKKKELFMARDRFGKKPLHYSYTKNKGIVFASEISALLADESINPVYSYEALNCYLALGYILSPMTVYENIFKLEAGHYMLIAENGSKISKEKYFNYAECFQNKNKCTEADAAAQINALLEDSVKLRMIGDVPVGAFLSGGIDSSSVVAKMKKFHNGELHTFSIGFEQKKYNELADADYMAGVLKTNHHDRMVKQESVRQLMFDSIAAFDEPFADNSLIPMLEVSRLASEKVKVVLSGDGADEIFAGYITYQADNYFHKAQVVPSVLRKLMLGIASRAGTSNKSKIGNRYKAKQFLYGSLKNEEEAHYSWRLIFHPEERINILGENFRQLVYDTDPFHRFKRFYDQVKGLHWLDKHLYVDGMTWLPDDILVKVDRTTMRCGLESRSPYLDINLVSFAASLPTDYKLRGSQTKYILKKSLIDVLPAQVLKKKKSGFNAPVGKWIGITEKDEFRSFNKFVYDIKIKDAAKKAK